MILESPCYEHQELKINFLDYIIIIAVYKLAVKVSRIFASDCIGSLAAMYELLLAMSKIMKLL